MTNLFPTASNTIRMSCLKSFFVIMLVWLLGLLMGSYLQVSTRSWLQSAPTSVSMRYKDQKMDLTFKDPRTYKQLSGHSYSQQLENSSVLCPFPDLDPFDPKIMKFVSKYPTLNCYGSIPSVVSVVGNELKIDSSKLKAKLHLLSIDDCIYRNLSMVPGDDYKLHYGAWSKKFSSSIRLDDKDENLQVDCHHKGVLVARSYVPLIRKKEETERKRLDDYKNHVKKNSPKETLSILFVGIDGTSKQNFIRSMPKTRYFVLKHLNGIELHKHNKVGLNTFPNVFAMLTGKFFTEAKNWSYKVPFDKIDHMFLWSQYQKAGYRTAIVMDMIRITAFHYLKKGWQHPGFDFYPRPITVASEGDKSVYRKKNANCMGDTPEVTLHHNYLLQLATAYNNSPSTPYFGYSFMARLTHDDQNKASSGDELYLNFFQEIKERNVLNNTVIVFFSDHGERFGHIRNTYNGIIESKTPFLFFIFPPWFEKKYPDLINNFRINSNRLTTHFDVYATLKDLLYLTGTSTKHSPTDRAISLFSEIPANRTCSVAGISVKFCVCTQISHKNVATSDVSKQLVTKFMEHVISLTKKYRNKCALLKLNYTKSIFPMTPEIPLTDKTMSLYHVTIQTSPGGAVYEATLNYKSDTKAANVNGDVSRLNMYKGQAECIFDLKLRPFCFCLT